MTVLVGVFVLIGLMVVVSVGLFLLAIAFLPSVSAAHERVRGERESQEASWRIHQQATRAFGQMLESARRDDSEDLS